MNTDTDADLLAGAEHLKPVTPLKKRATYLPRIADDEGGWRRWWRLPEGDVLDPCYDYTRQVFTGSMPESATEPVTWREATWEWNRDLTFHIAAQVPGCCTARQGWKLFDLAQQQAARGAQDGRGTVIVEVGSAFGLSATWLGWGARSADPHARLFCVDTFHGTPRGDGYLWPESVLGEFTGNIAYAGLRDHVTPIVGRSEEAAQAWDGSPISLLYVDASHTYHACRNDFLRFAPYLVPGAIVAFDDCIPAFRDIMRFQRELAAERRLRLLGRADAMLYWQVPES
ncbi:MAG: class I SAM-dependent methyltransferase [Nocardiopsaceae bacterium]|nr:class I SAM-dependent methyltransferase [Nocardiopsaceae bacterium]